MKTVKVSRFKEESYDWTYYAATKNDDLAGKDIVDIPEDLVQTYNNLFFDMVEIEQQLEAYFNKEKDDHT